MDEKLVKEEAPKFEGVVERLGGRDWVVPPLSVKQAKTLWPKILDMDAGITKDNLPDKHDKMIEVIHAAMSRNYPSLTVEEVEDLVDLKSIRRLVPIVMGQEGIKLFPGEKPDAVEKPLVQ